MTIQFNMFSHLMKDNIVGYMYICLTSHNFIGLVIGNPNTSSNIFVQVSLVEAIAIALYSTSALYLAATCCLFLFQITTFPPNVTE